MKKVLFIAVLFFALASCTDKEYLESLSKSRVTIKLYTMGGTLEKDYILPTKRLNSLIILQWGRGMFKDGYSVLAYFSPRNSWDGKTMILERNVYQFEIVSVEEIKK